MHRFRSVARRAVPVALRWRIRQALRSLSDRRARIAFVYRRDGPAGFEHRICVYTRPLICYPRQERAFAGKRRNIEIALAAVDGLRIAPGEMFSFWRCVGRPTQRAGYRRAAALKDGVLTEDIGGALCLVSTVLYNVALLAGMEIVERRCHSVDTYGPSRYFELGRDAAVEYAYIDLRFRNPHQAPLSVCARIEDGMVVAELRCPTAIALQIDIAVDRPMVDNERILVRTERRIVGSGRVQRDVSWSKHLAPWLNARAGSPERAVADTIVTTSARCGEGDGR
jgi:vancomycin resistance protein YoaR